MVTTTEQHRILIVDDDVRLTTVMSSVLDLEGFAVHGVHSAEDALLALRGPGFDMIVLDVMLPGVDGIQVCRHLRATGVTIPVLLVTGLNTDKSLLADTELGRTRIMYKPFALTSFVRTVHECLGETDAPAGPLTVGGDPGATGSR